MLKKIGELKDFNEIKILTDKTCEMKAVLVNGKTVMEGNYHDFYNGCHGDYDIPEFNSAGELAALLLRYIEKQGKEAEIVRESYRYE